MPVSYTHRLSYRLDLVLRRIGGHCSGPSEYAQHHWHIYSTIDPRQNNLQATRETITAQLAAATAPSLTAWQPVFLKTYELTRDEK